MPGQHPCLTTRLPLLHVRSSLPLHFLPGLLAWGHRATRSGRTLALLIGALTAVSASAQLIINEVCSKNNAAFADPDDDFPDWVEVYNTGTATIDLSDYFLTDSIFEPQRWRLPAMQLPAGGTKVFFSGDPDDGPIYFPFGLSRGGESLFLFDANAQQVNSLVVPELQADHSYGPDLDGALRYFGTPTPGAANTTQAFLGYAPTPQFSRAAGFHAAGSQVAITATNSAEIHVTWDGREPDATCTLYTGPLWLNSTQTVKAITLLGDHLPSAVQANTYLIDEHTQLPVISISTHNDSLFDEVVGIYMPGPNADPEYPHYGANFWEDHTIPVHVEFFEQDRTRRISQTVDLEIHGGRVSRNMPQRPFRLTARQKYGSDVMEHAFFPEKPWLQQFTTLVLRNSGADFGLGQIRDNVWHQTALHNGLDIDALGVRPAAVFINGQYWGLMEIRERIDKHYLHYNHGADRDDVLMMEEENISMQGDTIHFHDLKEYIHTHDMNDPMHFAHVDSLLDMASFKDYCALEMYAGNVDWPSNNLKYWKPSITEGKWRYLLYDLDATMNIYGWIPIDLDSFYWVLVHRAGFVHAEIFRSLMENMEFRRTFLNRLADLMNTSFSAERFTAEIDAYNARVADEIPRHYQRWGRSVGDWEEHARTIVPHFAQVRADLVRGDVVETYAFPNTASLTVDVFPPEAGTVKLNTLSPQLPFEGVYFNGNAIDLAVQPAPGFVLDHWAYSEEPDYRATTTAIQRSFPKTGAVTAYFRRSGEDMLVFPNPFDGSVSVGLVSGSAGTAKVTVSDATGRLVHVSSWNITPGMNAIQLDLTHLRAGAYQLSTEADGQVRTTRLLRATGQP